MTHLNYSLKKLGRTFELQKESLKTEMNHDEVDCNNYKVEKDGRLDYVKKDALCTAFSYAGYCEAIEENTGYSMKDYLSAPGLRWKHFTSFRTEEDEQIYTCIDKYMRHFVRVSIKGGRVCSFSQSYKSIICGDVSKIISREIKVDESVYDFN